MIKLNYTARRSDGTTISQLRGNILVEQATIADLEVRLQACRDTLVDYVSRLSQDERTQLVSNQPDLFPNGLPSTETVPYIGKQADNTTQI